jgi:hypothetical protein
VFDELEMLHEVLPLAGAVFAKRAGAWHFRANASAFFTLVGMTHPIIPETAGSKI